MLKTSLDNLNGYLREGIFRREPNSQELEQIKKQINSGEFIACNDPDIIATLFKQFLRGIPGGLFNIVPVNVLERQSKSSV